MGSEIMSLSSASSSQQTARSSLRYRLFLLASTSGDVVNVVDVFGFVDVVDNIVYVDDVVDNIVYVDDVVDNIVYVVNVVDDVFDVVMFMMSLMLLMLFKLLLDRLLSCV